MFWNKYPYANFHELNLDMILDKIRELNTEWDEFKVINTITFDGEWDITKQYPAWCIVNTNGGTQGYISIKPVPAGVTIDNTDYWASVVDYTATIADLQNRVIALEARLDLFTTPEEFGAIGDGVADDTAALITALASGKNVLLSDGAVYGIANPNTTLTIENITLFSMGDSTVKYLGDPSAVPRVGSVFLFVNAENAVIKNVKFDCGGTWVERPQVESGDAWNNYLTVRSNTITNVKVKDSKNLTISDCNFKGGLQGLEASNSSGIVIRNCNVEYTIADSFYIDNGSHNVLVENCTTDHNGDDAFCANVNDGAYIPPHDVTFINCTGSELHGSVCVSDSGNDITFIGCSGKTHRTAGLRAEHHAEATYGEGTKNIVFDTCSVEVYSDYVPSGGSAMVTTETKDYINVQFRNCIFDFSGKTASSTNDVQIVPGGMNVKYDHCTFKNVYIYIGTSYQTNIMFTDCYLDMICNAFVRSTIGFKVEGCTIINNGIIDDRYLTDGGTADTTYRRVFDFLNADVVFLNNKCSYAGTDGRTFNEISIDDYSNSSNVVTSTDSIKVENNQTGNNVYYTNGVMRRAAMTYGNATYTTAMLGAGSLLYTGSLLALSVDGISLRTFTPD